jgi:hypothetical protein
LIPPSPAGNHIWPGNKSDFIIIYLNHKEKTMNRNVTKTVTHHILPCLGLLIVEAVSCVLAVYGIVILLGHDAPSLYCVLSGILKAVALVILLLISVGSLVGIVGVAVHLFSSNCRCQEEDSGEINR